MITPQQELAGTYYNKNIFMQVIKYRKWASSQDSVWLLFNFARVFIRDKNPLCGTYVCTYVCMYVCMYVCVCMYVYMYVCMYVHMYVCVCIRMYYVYMYVCTYVRMCVYVCTYVRTYACMYVCTLCVCVYVCMYVCMCTNNGKFSRTANFIVFEDFTAASKSNSSESYCTI